MKTVAITLRIDDKLVTWNVPNVLRIKGGTIYLYEELMSLPIMKSDICRVIQVTDNPNYLIEIRKGE